jgi:hypothetical protein
MADKLKKGIAVVPTFSDGEAVRAGKLTALARQAARAVENVEKAVGDIYDESYPYSTDHETGLSMVWGRAKTTTDYLTDSRRSLDIANLGRLIGPAANLNPHFPTGDRVIVQAVPVGVYAFTLKYPLNNIEDIDVGETDDSALVTLVDTPDDLGALPNRFTFVSQTNEIICNTATSGGTITYTTKPRTYASGENYTGATFNVIPDPIQIDEGGEGCEVSASADSEGRHTVSLPTLTHMAKNEYSTGTELVGVDPGTGFQLVLPPVLTEDYAAGELIPTGFLYLKNHTTRQTYKDAVYTYIDDSSFYISGVDLEAEVAAGDKFVVVTVGTDITTSIDDLRRKMRSHSHTGEYGEEMIDARYIAGWTRKAGASGKFVPSEMSGNYAPQYLHRDGKRSDAYLNDDNAMRGNIWFGKTGGVAGQYLSVSGATYGVVFGGEDWSINRNGDDDLLIRAEAGKKVKVYGADVLQVHSAIDKKGSNEGEHTIEEIGVLGLSADTVRDIECGFLFSSSFGLGAHRVTGIFDGLFVGQVVDVGGQALEPWVLDQHAGGWSDNSATKFSTFTGELTYTTGSKVEGAVGCWRVPKINIVHYGVERQRCIFYDGTGSISTTWSSTDWAQVEIPLPSGFDENEVLAVSILVRRDDGEPWCSLGGLWNEGAEHPLRSIGFKIATGGTLKIYIPTDGISTGHSFHHDNWRHSEAANHNPHSGDYDMVDVKVTLTLAGQTRAGIANMVS